MWFVVRDRWRPEVSDRLRDDSLEGCERWRFRDRAPPHMLGKEADSARMDRQ